jgi:hypothetical protein
MTIGAWEPTPAAPATPSATLLRDFIGCVQTQPDALAAALTPAQREQGQRLMKLPRTLWIEVATDFSTEEVLALVRFFTLAEMQLPGWEAGADSPVIGLVKALRLRGAAPDKALLQWIREHSQNRYLPNGPLLG